MFIDLRKYIKPETVCVYTASLSKHSIIEKIADIVSTCNENYASLKLSIYEGLQAREMLGSTALSRGLALPHCRVECISNFIAGILVSPEGVAYGSLDGRLTHVFFFIIAPKEKTDEYLGIMAEIGAFLGREENITLLAESKNSEVLYQNFLKFWEEYVRNINQ
ncbi:MAG: PTS sugar transporter subunit IIA [Candidatus Hydrogenedens sp.]